MGTKFYYIIQGTLYLLVNKEGINHDQAPEKDKEQNKDKDKDKDKDSNLDDSCTNITTINSPRERSVSDLTKAAHTQRLSLDLTKARRGSLRNLTPVVQSHSPKAPQRRNSFAISTTHAPSSPLRTKDSQRNQFLFPPELTADTSSVDSPRQNSTSPKISATKRLRRSVNKLMGREIETEEEKLEKKFPTMKILKEMTKGTAFGEIALISHATR